jgi:hypothetical protein
MENPMNHKNFDENDSSTLPQLIESKQSEWFE